MPPGPAHELCLQQHRKTELSLQQLWLGLHYLNLLMKNLMVLLLLVQHVLLLRLLQRPLVHVPTVHLLELLTLLQGIQHVP